MLIKTFKFENALEEYKIAIGSTDGRSVDPNLDPDGYTAHNIASLYTIIFDFDAAESWYREAWRIQMSFSIPETEIATLMSNVASFYSSAGCINVAYKNAAAVVRGRGVVIPNRHPTLAFSLNTLGMSLVLSNKYERG